MLVCWCFGWGFLCLQWGSWPAILFSSVSLSTLVSEWHWPQEMSFRLIPPLQFFWKCLRMIGIISLFGGIDWWSHLTLGLFRVGAQRPALSHRFQHLDKNWHLWPHPGQRCQAPSCSGETGAASAPRPSPPIPGLLACSPAPCPGAPGGHGKELECRLSIFKQKVHLRVQSGPWSCSLASVASMPCVLRCQPLRTHPPGSDPQDVFCLLPHPTPHGGHANFVLGGLWFKSQSCPNSPPQIRRLALLITPLWEPQAMHTNTFKKIEFWVD